MAGLTPSLPFRGKPCASGLSSFQGRAPGACAWPGCGPNALSAHARPCPGAAPIRLRLRLPRLVHLIERTTVGTEREALVHSSTNGSLDLCPVRRPVRDCAARQRSIHREEQRVSLRAVLRKLTSFCGRRPGEVGSPSVLGGAAQLAQEQPALPGGHGDRPVDARRRLLAGVRPPDRGARTADATAACECPNTDVACGVRSG